MIGMNPHTGCAVQGLDHVYQSVAQILTTPKGTRVARRAFGSDLAQLIDAPNNGATRVRVYAAVATALMREEPRLKLTRVRFVDDALAHGVQVMDIHGIATASGEPVSTRVTVTPRSLA